MPLSIPLLFIDQTEAIFLRDINVIKKLPVFCRALEGMGDDWETKSLDPSDNWEVPFPKWAAEFIFETILKYTIQEDVKPDLAQFPEADRMSLMELKNIMCLANFWELSDYMSCVGFVVAQKLNFNNLDEVALFFGARAQPEDWFPEEHGWLRPPMVIFEQD